MEMVLNNGFCEFSQAELESISAGGWIAGIGAPARGILGVVAGPPSWITGAVAVGAYYVCTGSVAVAGFVSIFE